MTSIIRIFWWTGVQDKSSKPLYLKAWSEICRPKAEGGLGIRDLGDVNMALLSSTGWRILTEEESTTSKVLKAKCFPHSSFWKASSHVPKSAFWTSILKVRPSLIQSCEYQIYKGNTYIWNTPWVPFCDNIHADLIIQNQGFVYPNCISDLWIPGTRRWNVDLIRNLFGNYHANFIANIIVFDGDNPDALIWKHTPSGKCTTKSAYQNFKPHVYVDQTIPRTTFCSTIKNILADTWKENGMPPRVQVFAWRLLRQAIPTASRVAMRSSKVTENCKRCEKQEDDTHLFFLCDFARAVWFISFAGLRVDQLHQHG